jgi:hypothetical protein
VTRKVDLSPPTGDGEVARPQEVANIYNDAHEGRQVLAPRGVAQKFTLNQYDHASS